MAFLLIGMGLGNQPAQAGTSPGIVTIDVALQPTLLAIDPHTHQIYVRTLGITDHYGSPGQGAGYTLLDGTTGKVRHVWPDTDTGGYPPVYFTRTDNGLRASLPSHPRAGYTPPPALEIMLTQVGAQITTGVVDEVADQQGGLVALVTVPLSQAAHPVTYTLWIFNAKTAHVIAATKVQKQDVALAFDPAANRVLVAFPNSVQLFTLSGLHYLATIATQGYQEAHSLLYNGYNQPNRLYDSEPLAVDMSMGRAVAISGVNGKGTAQIIDMKSGRVLHTVSVGIQPINVQVDTTLHRAYILDTGSCEVNILDLRSEKLVANVAVGLTPLGLAVDEPTGKVFVTQPGGHVILFPADTTLHQSGCYPPYPSVQ